jgi:iron complex transport system ATP-binding protein
MSEAVLLAASSVSVSLGNRVVVRDISLALSGKHLVALVGPNGAGKTTLL